MKHSFITGFSISKEYYRNYPTTKKITKLHEFLEREIWGPDSSQQ